MAVLPRQVCYIRLNSVSGDNENKPTWSLTFYTLDVVGQTTFMSPSYVSRSSPRNKDGLKTDELHRWTNNPSSKPDELNFVCPSSYRTDNATLVVKRPLKPAVAILSSLS